MTLPWETIQQSAQRLGFDAIGWAPARRLDEEADHMEQWLAQGLHGDLAYLTRNRDKRYDIRQLVPGARSVVVALLTYGHSGHDYHRTMKSKLYELEKTVQEAVGRPIGIPETQHIFCDSAPVLERRWAVEARLGFIGKNRQFIHPILGSVVHIGEWILTADIQDGQSAAPVSNACGDCTLCQEACPHDALHGDWDARRCIAYVTHKCTVCQQVCPYNKNNETK